MVYEMAGAQDHFGHALPGCSLSMAGTLVGPSMLRLALDHERTIVVVSTTRSHTKMWNHRGVRLNQGPDIDVFLLSPNALCNRERPPGRIDDHTQ